MDKEIRKISSEVERMSDNLDKVANEVSELDRKFEDLRREVGVESGRNLSKQVDDIQRKLAENHHKINEVIRDVSAIRRLIELGDGNMKEIKQALALIYRNTDELESKLIADTRETY